MSLKDFRKDIIIEIYNEAGQLAIAYKVYRCWVSEYQALPDLDANANAVAIQHIKLENEGWERDNEVPEPTEPTFTEPAAGAVGRCAAPHARAAGLWERRSDASTADVWSAASSTAPSVCSPARRGLPGDERRELAELPIGRRDAHLLACANGCSGRSSRSSPAVRPAARRSNRRSRVDDVRLADEAGR